MLDWQVNGTPGAGGATVNDCDSVPGAYTGSPEYSKVSVWAPGAKPAVSIGELAGLTRSVATVVPSTKTVNVPDPVLKISSGSDTASSTAGCGLKV